jgi:hypothetical protein
MAALNAIVARFGRETAAYATSAQTILATAQGLREAMATPTLE